LSGLDGDRPVCGTEQKGEIGETIRRSLRESNPLYQITEPPRLGPANWSVVKFRKNRTNVRAKIGFSALPTELSGLLPSWIRTNDRYH
jgi:hypothetical protein